MSNFPKQKRKRLKILTFIGNIKIFPMALVQVKQADKTVDNASVNVISEIRQIIYSLFLDKEFRKKVYNNLMSLIKL